MNELPDCHNTHFHDNSDCTILALIAVSGLSWILPVPRLGIDHRSNQHYSPGVVQGAVRLAPADILVSIMPVPAGSLSGSIGIKAARW